MYTTNNKGAPLHGTPSETPRAHSNSAYSQRQRLVLLWLQKHCYNEIKRLDVAYILESLILKRDGHVLSPAGAYHRRDALPHRFVPIGGGLVVPIGMNGEPCGYRPGQRDIYSVPHLAIREELIAREFLILGEFMFMDQASLFDRSPYARRVYTVRAYLVLKQIGILAPRMPRSTFWKIRDALICEGGGI